MAAVMFAAGCGEAEASPQAEDIPIPSQRRKEAEDRKQPDMNTQDPGGEPSSGPLPTGPRTYSIGEQDSLLYIQVFKDESAAFSSLAHNHVVRATGWYGTIVYDPTDLRTCTVSIEVPAHGLRADERVMRDLVGYEERVDDGDRAEIEKNMFSDDQLNPDKYPSMSFTSSACAAGDTENLIAVAGDLKIRGKTKTVELVLDVAQDGDAGVFAKGTVSVKHSDFGFEPYSAFFGAVKNAETMKLTVDIYGVAQPSS